MESLKDIAVEDLEKLIQDHGHKIGELGPGVIVLALNEELKRMVFVTLDPQHVVKSREDSCVVFCPDCMEAHGVPADAMCLPMRVVTHEMQEKVAGAMAEMFAALAKSLGVEAAPSEAPPVPPTAPGPDTIQ